MGRKKVLKMIKNKKVLALGLSFGLIISPLVIISQLHHQEPLKVEAADYSGVSGGFSHGSDGSISASFTVTNNSLDMKGWLLCLFESKPTVDSNNKLTDSNDAHPYSYSDCKHYFFASNTSKTGQITVSWSANAADQKQAWSSGTSSGQTGKCLKDYIDNGTNWHLIIGPRHYNTSWGDSGIGAGTDGYWENCDYYVGALKEVFPEDDKDMNVSVMSEIAEYDGTPSSIYINVMEPSSGYTIKYRTTSSGEYNLTTNPSFTNVGFYTVYFQITCSGYKTYTDSGTVEITKGTPTYTAPTAKMGLLYNAEDQYLIDAGSTSGGTMKYSIDGNNYSTDIPTKKYVGDYTVYYKVEGDSNWNGISAKTIQVGIYENDKQALGASLNQANEYHDEIALKYPAIALKFDLVIEEATLVYEDPNRTVEEIANAKQDLIEAYDLAHAEIVDTLIKDIGEVRLNNKCHEDIVEAEVAYEGLSEEQKELVTYYSDLLAARDLFDRLQTVNEAIEAIGEITYDQDCLNRILAAQEAFDQLDEDEKMLVPTLFNDLNSAKDIYNVLSIIANLGDVEYSEEYKDALEEARNAFNALDHNEQDRVYNYQNLLDAEETYKNVDNFVKLVNEIDENLEYVGTHNPEIDRARHAYDLLSDEEKLLVPVPTYEALTTAEEEYHELKVEHERKQVEDAEAGVTIAIDGGSGIPDTVSIDINNSSGNGNSEGNMEDNIDYQTIQGAIGEDENIESICEIKFYTEIDGEIVEVSLEDIDEGLTLTIKLEIPEDVDDTNFRIVLLDKDNNLIEMRFTYDPSTRTATIVTDKVGTFAILTPVPEPEVCKDNNRWPILLAVAVVIVIGVVGYFSIKEKKRENQIS